MPDGATTMRDEELIELLEGASPDELSVEQLQALRGRVASSPAVRQALAAHLRLQQSLAETFAQVRVSLGTIMNSPPPPSKPGGGWSLPHFGFGLGGAGLLLLVGLGVTLWRPDWLPWQAPANRLPPPAAAQPAEAPLAATAEEDRRPDLISLDGQLPEAPVHVLFDPEAAALSAPPSPSPSDDVPILDLGDDLPPDSAPDTVPPDGAGPLGTRRSLLPPEEPGRPNLPPLDFGPGGSADRR